LKRVMKNDLIQAFSCGRGLIRYAPTRASRNLYVALGFRRKFNSQKSFQLLWAFLVRRGQMREADSHPRALRPSLGSLGCRHFAIGRKIFSSENTIIGTG
jgi:hypothetical protein